MSMNSIFKQHNCSAVWFNWNTERERERASERASERERKAAGGEEDADRVGGDGGGRERESAAQTLPVSWALIEGSGLIAIKISRSCLMTKHSRAETERLYG